jgi:hypothetical protein
VIAGLFTVTCIFAAGPAWALALRRLLGNVVAGPWFFVDWIAVDLGGEASAVAARQPLHIAAWSTSMLLALILWWWSRRRGKRKALKALGAKARARVAAMVKNMPKPGPVLRPVPQGARA